MAVVRTALEEVVKGEFLRTPSLFRSTIHQDSDLFQPEAGRYRLYGTSFLTRIIWLSAFETLIANMTFTLVVLHGLQSRMHAPGHIDVWLFSTWKVCPLLCTYHLFFLSFFFSFFLFSSFFSPKIWRWSWTVLFFRCCCFDLGLQHAIAVSVVHPTWQKTRPGTDDHAGWVFRSETDPPLKSVTGHGSFGSEGCVPDVANGCQSVREVRSQTSMQDPAQYLLSYILNLSCCVEL